MLKQSTLMLLTVLISFGFAGPSYSAGKQYVVSGSIQYPDNGRLYLFLIDEEIFKIPQSGRQTLVLDASQSGSVDFLFKNIPAGQYGIRCFQDVNGNGKLDGGVFGPKEPWGMSWNSEKPSRWPRFKNILFKVEGDIHRLNIELK